MADYSVIMLILLVVIIIIGIILIIYANRGNTTNILATLPNYRILHVSSNTYLGLKNLQNMQVGNTTHFPIPITTLPNLVPFWKAYVSAGLSNNDPLGLWKIETISQSSNVLSTVKVVNTIYNLQTTNNLGYLRPDTPGNLPIQYNLFFSPEAGSNGSTIFKLTVTAINEFTLTANDFSVFIDKTTNILRSSNNKSIKSDTFRLQLV